MSQVKNSQENDVAIALFWHSVEVLGISGVNALSMSEENIRELPFVSSSTTRVTVDDFESAKINLIKTMDNSFVRLAQKVTLLCPAKAAQAEAEVDAKAKRLRLLERLHARISRR